MKYGIVALKITSFYIGPVNTSSSKNDVSHKLQHNFIPFKGYDLQRLACYRVVK